MSSFFSTLLSLLKIVCAVALFGVVFIASGYLAVYWALSAEEFEVPDVVGRPLGDAERILTQRGLLVEVEEVSLADDDVPEGHVLRQNPPAGTAIKRQRGIQLTLSSGVRLAVLPVTVGNALPRAQIALEQKNVGVEYVARVHSWEFEKDRVIAQQPDSAELPRGTTVPARLLVSLGPPPRIYVMPDLVYRSEDEVVPFLEKLGFRVQTLPQPTRGQPQGTIVRHEPSIGFPVREGDLIVLRVNKQR